MSTDNPHIGEEREFPEKRPVQLTPEQRQTIFIYSDEARVHGKRLAEIFPNEHAVLEMTRDGQLLVDGELVPWWFDKETASGIIYGSPSSVEIEDLVPEGPAPVDSIGGSTRGEIEDLDLFGDVELGGDTGISLEPPEVEKPQANPDFLLVPVEDHEHVQDDASDEEDHRHDLDAINAASQEAAQEGRVEVPLQNGGHVTIPRVLPPPLPRTGRRPASKDNVLTSYRRRREKGLLKYTDTVGRSAWGASVGAGVGAYTMSTGPVQNYLVTMGSIAAGATGVVPPLVDGATYGLRRGFARLRHERKVQKEWKKTLAEIQKKISSFSDNDAEESLQDHLRTSDRELINTDREVELLKALHKAPVASPAETPYLVTEDRYARYCFAEFQRLCENVAAGRNDYRLSSANCLALCRYAVSQDLSAIDTVAKAKKFGLLEEVDDEIRGKDEYKDLKDSTELPEEFQTHLEGKLKEIRRRRVDELMQMSVVYGKMLHAQHTDRRSLESMWRTLTSAGVLSLATWNPVPAIVGAGWEVGKGWFRRKRNKERWLHINKEGKLVDPEGSEDFLPPEAARQMLKNGFNFNMLSIFASKDALDTPASKHYYNRLITLRIDDPAPTLGKLAVREQKKIIQFFLGEKPFSEQGGAVAKERFEVKDIVNDPDILKAVCVYLNVTMTAMGEATGKRILSWAGKGAKAAATSNPVVTAAKEVAKFGASAAIPAGAAATAASFIAAANIPFLSGIAHPALWAIIMGVGGAATYLKKKFGL